MSFKRTTLTLNLSDKGFEKIAKLNILFFLFSVPPSDLLLRLGEYDLAEEEEPYGYQERRVQIVASHPQFDPRTFEYDLALLRFYEPVEFQPNIIPVCVPETEENFIGRTAFVTGWGRLYEGLSTGVLMLEK